MASQFFVLEYKRIPTEINGLRLPHTNIVVIEAKSIGDCLIKAQNQYQFGADCISVSIKEIDDTEKN